jgi:5,10-methenyltetrahydrofolate synthetase
MTSPHNPVGSAQHRRLLRKQLIAAREGMDARRREQATISIGLHLDAWLASFAPRARVIALYSPHRGEVDLTGWALGRVEKFALPLVTARHAPLTFAAWKPGEPTVPDTYGIATPEKIVPVRPDVLLIPCVGFSNRRIRLGYGGGYYDRTLVATEPRPVAVGIAFEAQRCRFDPAAHDIALDAIITEAGAL